MVVLFGQSIVRRSDSPVCTFLLAIMIVGIDDFMSKRLKMRCDHSRTIADSSQKLRGFSHSVHRDLILYFSCIFYI